MRIADRTLCRENCAFSFKEKIEICRQLEKLKVDIMYVVTGYGEVFLIMALLKASRYTQLLLSSTSQKESGMMNMSISQ